MTKRMDRPNPPKGLVDRLRHFERHQIESGDEYGAEVLRRAAEEIARLARERDEVVERLQHVQEQLDQMAATSIREMEGWTADALRTAIAFERATNAELRAHNHQLRVNLHRARTDAARLQEELDKAWACADLLPDPGPAIVRNATRALVVERKARTAAEARVDELERVIIDLRELLEAAEFWLEHTPQEERTIGMLKVLGRIRAELAGSSEPKPEVPPVSALRWVADTVERGDSELDCSLEEVNAVIRWLRAWVERVEGKG